VVVKEEAVKEEAAATGGATAQTLPTALPTALPTPAALPTAAALLTAALPTAAAAAVPSPAPATGAGGDPSQPAASGPSVVGLLLGQAPWPLPRQPDGLGACPSGSGSGASNVNGGAGGSGGSGDSGAPGGSGSAPAPAAAAAAPAPAPTPSAPPAAAPAPGRERQAKALPWRERLRLCRALERERLAFGKSGVHGWGIFAKRAIPQDTPLFEYRGDSVRSIVADLREQRYRAEGRDCYLFFLNEHVVLDATSEGSISRFTNHCCAPSLYTKNVDFDGESHVVFFTKASGECSGVRAVGKDFPTMFLLTLRACTPGDASWAWWASCAGARSSVT
jgi:hypothetical protein